MTALDDVTKERTIFDDEDNLLHCVWCGVVRNFGRAKKHRSTCLTAPSAIELVALRKVIKETKDLMKNQPHSDRIHPELFAALQELDAITKGWRNDRT